MDGETLRQSIETLAAMPLVTALSILFFSSLIEYVFPPFPGDTIAVAGAVLATVGGWGFAGVFVVLTAGSLVGAWLDYEFGRRALSARRIESMKRMSGHQAAVRRVEKGYRKWGPVFLVANRFLPGIRGFFFVAAGSASIPRGKVLLFAGISAAVWNVLLMVLGAAIGENLDTLASFLSSYLIAVWVALLVGAVFLVGLWIRRRRASST